jgi:DNA-binding response OmpR family regulator
MSRTILLVEDDQLCASFLKVVLRSVPECDVKVVATAFEALQTLEQNPVHLLVTDLHLPSLDGFQLIEHVRSQGQFAKLPILVISGDGQKDTDTRVRNLGANNYIAKPYSPADVRRAVKELFDEA